MANEAQIVANDQVIFRKQIRNGVLLRMGSVIRVDGGKALVHFPIDHSQAVIPVAGLEKTSTRYGTYVRVQNSAVLRGIHK